MELSGFSHQSQSFVLLINVKMPTMAILTFMSRINFMLGWAESERSFITSGPSVHVSGTKLSYMLLLVLFSILSFGFLFFHVHHLCMPLLGPELVNKILVSCIDGPGNVTKMAPIRAAHEKTNVLHMRKQR